MSPPDAGTKQQDLITENAALRRRLDAAEAALRAVRGARHDSLPLRAMRTLVEHSSDGALILDEEGFLHFANRRAAELLGFPPGELTGSTIQDLLAPDARVAIAALLASTTAHSTRVELTLSTGAGQRTPVEVTVYRPDGQAAPVTLCAIVTDLSERKRAEQVIDEQLAEIVFHYDNAPVGLAALDTDLRFLRINPLMAELNGLPVVEHIGRTVAEIVPDMAAQVRQLADTILVTGEAITEIELSGETPAQPGVKRFWLAGWYPIWRNHEEIVGFNVIAQEVTEQKRTEEALRQSESLLRQVADNLPAFVAYAGAKDLCYRFVNRQYAISFKRPRKQIIGRPVRELLGEANFAFAWPYIQRALAGEACSYENTFTLAEGRRWIHVSFVPDAGQDGAVQGIVILSRDITEQKQAEAERDRLRTHLAQAQKMELVGRLAGGVAHEFNNMLAVIMLRTEMLLHATAPGTKTHRSLSDIHAVAMRSATLVHSLLGYARKQIVVPKVLDLNVAIVNAIPVVQKLLGEEVELTWNPGAALWPVRIDPSQFEQVLVNLCVNARDAINSTGTISIETADVVLAQGVDVNGLPLRAGDYVMLAVCDTGCGMDDELLAHIFEPFFTTKEVGSGTGLGLAAVDGIVQQNHGHIQVRSKPGIGTTFKIYLPRLVEMAGSLVYESLPALPRGKGETILLVEDEVFVLEMAAETLRYLGYTVIEAAAPAQALQRIRDATCPVDLLITDIVLPAMNGSALATQIAAIQPDIKCLFVSGYPADMVAQRGVLGCGVSFLHKPFSLHELATTVSQALGNTAHAATQPD